jgi:hypothetical protein
VKKSTLLAATAAVMLTVASGPASAGPQLTLPDFSHLQSKARESVDLSIDGFLLRIASKVAQAAADDSEEAEALRLLSDIKSVEVRVFEFEDEGVYSQEDIESVRRQLSGPGWSAVVHQRRRAAKENIDVYINTDGDRIHGIAVIASIDVDKLAKLEGQFGIPRTSTKY